MGMMVCVCVCVLLTSEISLLDIPNLPKASSEQGMNVNCEGGRRRISSHTSHVHLSLSERQGYNIDDDDEFAIYIVNIWLYYSARLEGCVE